MKNKKLSADIAKKWGCQKKFWAPLQKYLKLSKHPNISQENFSGCFFILMILPYLNLFTRF